MLRPFAWPSTAPAAVGDTAVSAGGAATPTRLRRLRWRAELAGYRLLVALLHALGHGSALYLGESVGRLIPWVAPRRRRIALADLRRVFGATRSQRQLDAIARASLRTLGGNMAELLWLRGVRREQLARFVDLSDTAPAVLDAAVARQRPMILVGIHFSRWELMFLGFNLTGRQFALVTRPLANPLLDDYLARIRCRFGNTVVHTSSRDDMHAVLAGGGTLLISMDHRGEPGRAAVVDFLGQATPLTTGIARFALRYDATLVPIYPLPLAGGRLRIEIGPIIDSARSGDTERDVAVITQRCAAVLGGVIRRHPQYWMWSHKRLWN